MLDFLLFISAVPLVVSYTDEVLPEELCKIFATFDRTVASLDKKHGALVTSSGASTGKIAAYAPVKSRRTAGKGE